MLRLILTKKSSEIQIFYSFQKKMIVLIFNVVIDTHVEVYHTITALQSCNR